MTRNRVKRLMREAVRARAAHLPRGWDMVVIAREPSRMATYPQMTSALAHLLAQARWQDAAA